MHGDQKSDICNIYQEAKQGWDGEPKQGLLLWKPRSHPRLLLLLKRRPRLLLLKLCPRLQLLKRRRPQLLSTLQRVLTRSDLFRGAPLPTRKKTRMMMM